MLWRPGLTIWLNVWGNNNNETPAERLAWIKDEASPARFDVRESVSGGLIRFSYRLREGDDGGAVESLNGYVIGADGHLQLSVYFDEAADFAEAQQLVDSVAIRRRQYTPVRQG